MTSRSGPGSPTRTASTGGAHSEGWAAVVASAKSVWTDGSAGDRIRYALAAALAASGVAHLGVQVVVGGPWDGPVSWRKPATFGLAFGLTLATLTWVTTFVPMPPIRRARVLSVFAAACVVEVAVITIQAWRHVPSHFNVSTPLNAFFAYTAAAGGAAIIGTTLVVAVAAAGPAPLVAPSMRLAVRVGLVTFLVALATGAAMIAIGVRATRLESQAAAYTAAEHLKAAHAATMHGVLVLPALAWLASFTAWPEVTRLRVVVLACAGYVIPAAVVVAGAVQGVAPLDAVLTDAVSAVLDGVGVACLIAAATAVLVGITRSRATTGARLSSSGV